MTKDNKKISDDTELNNDLDAFEEWESGDETDPGTENGDAASDDAEVPAFEEFPEELPEEELVSPSPDRQPEAEIDPESAADAMESEIAGLAPDVPVSMVAVIGRTTTNVGEMINYRIGDVVDLSRAPGETVDVVVNGKLFAKGELVEMDGKLGVRILKMVR